MRTILGLALLAVIAASSATAQTPAPTSFTVISPIFSQLVTYRTPSTFVAVNEDSKGPRYIRESVLKGENLANWTQMITIVGTKGAAGNPKVTPESYAGSMAGGFKNACPDTFTARALGPAKLGEYDAFAAVASCGNVSGGTGQRSETTLLVTFKGTEDLYTLQWAERGPASAAIPIDEAKWLSRLKQLQPIRLCPIIPGERAPYPSCVNKS